MKIVTLTVLLIAMVANCCHASFVSIGSVTAATNPASTVNYGVWQGSGSNITGTSITVASGTYAYLYQLVDTSPPLPKFLTVSTTAALSGFGSLASRYNFTSPGVVTGATVTHASWGANAGGAVADFGGNLNGHSQLLYFMSTSAPGVGDLKVFTGGLTSTSFATMLAPVPAAVPVPVPPALALVLAGAPFAEFIRRRGRRS